MKKIFYGGTFNPPHLGHTRLAQAVLERGLGDEIIFAPAWIPPHTQDASMEHCSVSDVEGREKGISYTIRSLHLLSAEFPDDTIALLIGSDSLAQLYSWFRPGDIVFEYEVLTYPRPGKPVAMEDLLDHWGPEWAGKLYAGIIRGLPEFSISSSEIREALRTGKDSGKYLNRNVLEYIKQRSLYEH